MEKRLLSFFALSLLLLIGHGYFMAWMESRRPKPEVAQAEAKPGDAADAPAGAAADAPTDGDKPNPPNEANEAFTAPADGTKPDEQTPGEQKPAEQAADAPAEPQPEPFDETPLEVVTIGSADPKSPERMLVTITNQGAAVKRIELNDPHYANLEDPDGYLGYLAVVDATEGLGCLVMVVGPGTPAEKAGIKVGDVITAVDGIQMANTEAFDQYMSTTRPEQKLTVTIRRDGQQQEIAADLTRRPLEVVRPEDDSPLSFLMAVEQIGGDKVPESGEIAGAALRDAKWQIRDRSPEKVTLVRSLPKYGLDFLKTYSLAKGEPKEGEDDPGYDLKLNLEIQNHSGEAREVAYQLDGPTGLPLEGWWYASKISRDWGSSGLRDVVAGFMPGRYVEIGTTSPQAIIAKDDMPDWATKPLVSRLAFTGVDAQYFSCLLIPRVAEDQKELAFTRVTPIVVGEVPTEKAKLRLANTSVRLTSSVRTITDGANVNDEFTIFAGPKRPSILRYYGLDGLVYYGWPIFAAVARPMSAILHTFYRIIPNYGVAIILLTVMVRLLMFPISRKQALNAQKMQELQPEMKRINEKYKNNMEQRSKAQQELFRKHGYNPLSGCLPLFIQLPIFIGLYRSLSVDIELRQAPLLSESIRWCSNLAAPDMLFRWDGFMPAMVVSWLGPYFNLLPIITVGLFVVQQKMLMPPPADEQAAMQAKMMQYMMLVMGLLFFKVASGLCIYFIASSLWGLAERKLIPKPGAQPAPVAVAARRG